MTPRRKAAVAIALWPLLITAVALAIGYGFMDSLPESVATHWGTDGADGFTRREYAPLLALIGLVIAWPGGALIHALAGGDGIHRRLATGFAAGIAAFVSGTMISTLWVQRGLTDGSEAGSADLPVTLSMLAALTIGTLAAFTVPGPGEDATSATAPVPATAPRAEILGDGDATWRGTARPSAGVWVVFAAVPLLFLGIAVVADMWFFMLVMTVLTVGIGVTFSAFRVTVGRDGLVITGLLGRPRWRIPLSDMAEAARTSVSPFRDFGGWGYRLGRDGRTGFVVRAGEALEVTRGDGSRWVVTVDDAERAAGLLNTLAERERS